MGRDLPVYCEHDKLIDGGDFFDEVPGCEECSIEPYSHVEDARLKGEE